MESEPPPMMNNDNDSSGDELFGGGGKTATVAPPSTAAAATGGVTESSGYATDNVHRSIFFSAKLAAGKLCCFWLQKQQKFLLNLRISTRFWIL